jgi:hypothetical protein
VYVTGLAGVGVGTVDGEAVAVTCPVVVGVTETMGSGPLCQIQVTPNRTAAMTKATTAIRPHLRGRIIGDSIDYDTSLSVFLFYHRFAAEERVLVLA